MCVSLAYWKHTYCLYLHKSTELLYAFNYFSLELNNPLMIARTKPTTVAVVVPNNATKTASLSLHALKATRNIMTNTNTKCIDTTHLHHETNPFRKAFSAFNLSTFNCLRDESASSLVWIPPLIGLGSGGLGNTSSFWLIAILFYLTY